MINNILDTQISGTILSWILQNKNLLGLGSVPDAQLQLSLNQILPNQVANYNASLYQQTNQSLNQGPKELLGTVNPFNTQNSNLSPANISTAVLSRVGLDQLNLDRSNFTTSLMQALQQQLGPYATNLDFTQITNAVTGFSSELFNGINKTVSSNFIDGVLNNEFESEEYVDTSSISFDNIEDPDTDLEPLDADYAKSAASTFLQQSRNYNIQEPENVEKLEVTKVGFTDPTGTYPTKEYAGKSEVNKLAQGDPTNSVVQAKNAKLMKSAPLPGEQFFNEPASAFKGEYPYNKVTETESGHIIEIDDTPGAERIHVYHKAGTYIEIDRDGNTVFRRKGSDYQIIDKNGYVSVAGTLNISVSGSVNMFAGNSANIEVIGDAKLTVRNDLDIQAGGNINISATDTLSLHARDIKIESDADTDFQIDGVYRHRANIIHSISQNETFVEVGKTYNMVGNTNAKIQFAENYEVKSGTSIKNTADTSIQFKAPTFQAKGAGSGLELGGTAGLRSSGTVNIDGDFLYMQTDTAMGLDTLDFSLENPTRPVGAKNSFAGLLDGRKSFVSIHIPDSQAIGIADKYCIDAEEQSDDPDTKQRLKEKLISRGLATEKELDAAPVQQSEVKTASSGNKQVVMPSDFCLGLSEAPDGFKLSPNFTLAQLTTRAACSSTKLQPQLGLSFGQLLQNLQAVALNICEPVFNLYPNMYITSAFRLPGSNPTSQHPKGQAVDIQFKNTAKSEYFKIANLLAQALNYDQLLLEYSSYTNNPWIHISFSFNSKNRSQVLTFWNNKTHAQGLVQLA